MVRFPSVPAEKPLRWVGSAKQDYMEFPRAVRGEIGYALSLAQFGTTHRNAKPWKGIGTGVFEIVESHDGDAYRAVYTVRFEKAVYVLHVFQKKSPSGKRTARADIELIASRLRDAKEVYDADGN